MSDFRDKLLSCSSIQAVLQLLLVAARSVSLSNIRYYHCADDWSPTDAPQPDGPGRWWESIDGVGHKDQVIEKMMRSGSVDWMGPERPSEGDGPFFYAVSERRPVIQVREDLKPRLPSFGQPTPRLMPYPTWEPPTEPTETDAWIDIPLLVGDQVVGKLSCDIPLLGASATADGGRGSGDQDGTAHLAAAPGRALALAHFLEAVRFATTHLAHLSGEEVFAFFRAGQRIMACKSYDDLYGYCTRELPHTPPFKFAHATVLALARESGEGSDRVERLLLRAASLPDLHGEVHVRNYRKDMAGSLTVWVWKQGRSLVLHDLDDEAKREMQLQRLDPPTRWLRHVQTGDADHNLLIVPIHFGNDKGRRVIGILRFADKVGEGDTPRINEREQRLLERIADRFLGPKMKGLMYETFFRQVVDNLRRFDQLAHPSKRGDVAWQQTLQVNVEELLRDLFVLPGGRRLFLVNLADDTTRTFYPIVVAGEAKGDFDVKQYGLEGSLTQYVMSGHQPRSEQPKSWDWVFLLDLKRARDKGRFHPSLANARCALASPIRFGEKSYGAVVVLSTRYDITAAHYGRALNLLAIRIGQVLARRDFSDFHSMIRGLRHDAKDLVGHISSLIERPGGCPPPVAQPALNGLRYLSQAIDTHCLTEPYTPRNMRLVAIHGDYVNVRTAITRTSTVALVVARGSEAAQRLSEHVEVDVPEGLRVHLHEPYLSVILFNLLVNAWKFCPAPCRPVGVRAWVKGAYIIVTISNDSSPDDYDRVEAAVKSPGVHFDGFEYGQPGAPSRGDGLRLVRRLVSWHCFPDTPAGERFKLIPSESKEKVQLEISLPIVPCQDIPE